jgi:hypothetical protein
MHTLTWLRDRVLVRRQGRPDIGYPAASPELLTHFDEYLAARATATRGDHAAPRSWTASGRFWALGARSAWR